MKTLKEMQSIDYTQNRDIYKFNDREQWFRQLYYTPEGKFLAQPMSYAEYEQLIEDHPEYLEQRNDYEKGI